MKILVLSSLSWSLVNFRGPLIARMTSLGHQVVACAPDPDREAVAALAQLGAGFRLTPMARAGTNPIRDLGTLFAYIRAIRAEHPDVIIAYTQKPIIWGGVAARLAGNARFFAIMSGLGHVFSEDAGRGWLRTIVSRLYRIALRRAACVFVFNGDDRRLMLENDMVGRAQRVLQVPGSGIDVSHFAAQPMPDAPMTFLMIGRLMRDKGVGEYVGAARLLRARWPDARFLLLGRPETENPTGCTAAEIAEWQRHHLVELLPETRDVRPCLAAAHVFVLPSYYREGLPRTILEAMASGRPVITTDMPGCREPVRPGVNGFLVAPRDAVALAEAMKRFLKDPALLEPFGLAARRTAVENYNVDLVNRQLLEAMSLDAPSSASFDRGLPTPVAA